MNQKIETETFRINSGLMRDLRTHFMEKARREGKNTYYGILQAGIEGILRNYLKDQKEVKYEAEN